MVRRSLLILLALGLSSAALAQPATRAAAKPAPGFREEFLGNLDEVQKKIVDLANAVPADKYSWRPAEGVRSISEVFTHIAGGNYYLATFLGVPPPAEMPKEIEKITDKKKVLAELQKSFDHVRQIVKSDTDYERTVKLYGNDTTRRNVYMMMLNHLHEHLGQSVAYARMNGIVPPWSAAETVPSAPPAPTPRGGSGTRRLRRG
ncbi:MAG: DinB family protein [Acidobacteria bacterium]|nr:DinB family protein [Acidobacteriota bacterium]